jgi:signal transduction histidine kinase
MVWLATLLAAGIGFTVLIDRILRMRQIGRIKDRFAADLHDELGANIHAIGMLNEIAKDADSEDERKMLNRRIATLTEQTGTAVRHCTNMLEAKNLYLDLVEDMKRTTRRIATNIEHDFSASGETELTQLKARTRTDLFLFYKESLVNVCRHSGATKMNARLKATPSEVRITIDDNGIGITDSTIGIPPSLQRRARLIGAKVAVSPSPLGGTQISLTLHKRRHPFQRKRL